MRPADACSGVSGLGKRRECLVSGNASFRAALTAAKGLSEQSGKLKDEVNNFIASVKKDDAPQKEEAKHAVKLDVASNDEKARKKELEAA